VRALAAVAAVAVACLMLSGVARADGDPASDVLIVATRFEPYTAKIPPASRKQLVATIAAARAKGYPVRVAMIGDQYDLGSAGLLMNHPQDYSKFLAQELAQFNKDWTLVVMPNGYGVYRCVPIPHPDGDDECGRHASNASDIKALQTLGKPHGDLALSADSAVRKLAALHGASLGGGPPVALIVGGVVVVLAVGVGGFLLVRRRRARVG
jgi:hypothetical protein